MTACTVYPKKYAHGFVVLCFVVVCNRSQWIHMNYLSIFIRVALLALGQSLDCHSASEVSLMDMGKSVNVWPQQSTAKQKPCAYFLGYTVAYLRLRYMLGQFNLSLSIYYAMHVIPMKFDIFFAYAQILWGSVMNYSTPFKRGIPLVCGKCFIEYADLKNANNIRTSPIEAKYGISNYICLGQWIFTAFTRLYYISISQLKFKITIDKYSVSFRPEILLIYTFICERFGLHW